MKPEYKILLTGLLTICLFDALGSIASRQFNFNFALLSPVSFIIYGTFGFIAAKNKNLITGVATATAIGLFDATIGWGISILLIGNAASPGNKPVPALLIGSAMFVIISAAIVGLIAGGLAKIICKK